MFLDIIPSCYTRSPAGGEIFHRGRVPFAGAGAQGAANRTFKLRSPSVTSQKGILCLIQQTRSAVDLGRARLCRC